MRHYGRARCGASDDVTDGTLRDGITTVKVTAAATTAATSAPPSAAMARQKTRPAVAPPVVRTAVGFSSATANLALERGGGVVIG